VEARSKDSKVVIVSLVANREAVIELIITGLPVNGTRVVCATLEPCKPVEPVVPVGPIIPEGPVEPVGAVAMA